MQGKGKATASPPAMVLQGRPQQYPCYNIIHGRYETCKYSSKVTEVWSLCVVSLAFVLSCHFLNRIFVVFLNSLILELPVDRLRSKVSLDSLRFLSVKLDCEKGEMWSGKTADVCTKEHGFPWVSTQLIYFFIHFVTFRTRRFQSKASTGFPGEYNFIWRHLQHIYVDEPFLCWCYGCLVEFCDFFVA